MTRPIIVWFRRDLRLSDHAALNAAARQGAPVIPVYLHDPEAGGEWSPGAASLWWLHHSLARLAESVSERGGRLLLRRGDAGELLERLAQEMNASAVYCHRRYEPWADEEERALHDRLKKQAVEFRRFAGGLLFDPDQVRTGQGEPYKVFTPFWKACKALEDPPRPRSVPELEWTDAPGGEDLDDWGLLPTSPDWAGGLRESWTPGESGAGARLEAFIDQALDGYGDDRNRPDRVGTSRLSPHLHFGEVSPRQVWHRVLDATVGEGRSGRGAWSYLRELGWREFSHHLLHHWPSLPSRPFRDHFEAFPWRDDGDALSAWQRGLTGFPIVDAGMRELWHTGWMHNRVRMIVASFLVKDLMIPWQAGEAWFWDTLVDADLANNAASWQWVAGCGADAAPYFRIFNPVLQGEKFDPKGEYVRRWVPELAGLAGKAIHAPWSQSEEALEKAGVVLGESYPRPLVDRSETRERALAAFKALPR